MKRKTETGNRSGSIVAVVCSVILALGCAGTAFIAVGVTKNTVASDHRTVADLAKRVPVVEGDVRVLSAKTDAINAVMRDMRDQIVGLRKDVMTVVRENRR